MNFPWFRKPPTSTDAARLLARIAPDRERARIRAQTDAMRRDLGLPAITWPVRP